jgi:hypothetical protein
LEASDTFLTQGAVSVSCQLSAVEGGDSLYAVAKYLSLGTGELIDSDDTALAVGTAVAQAYAALVEHPDVSTVLAVVAYIDPEKGTVVVSPLTTAHPQDSFPTHVDTYGLGGLVACQSLTERDNIAGLRRKPGMIASVVSTGMLYRLEVDMVTWTPLPVGTSTVTGDHTREFNFSYTTGTIPLYFLSAGETITRVTLLVTTPWNGAGAYASIGFKGDTAELLPPSSVELSSADVAFDVEVSSIEGPGLVDLVSDGGIGASTGAAKVRLYISP